LASLVGRRWPRRVLIMRVLHVTSTYPRSGADPTGGFLVDLVVAEASCGAGIEAWVVAPHDAGLAADAIVGNIGVHRFRYGPERFEVLAYRGGLLSAARRPSRLVMVPAYLVGLVLATATQARRRRVDLIHAHWWFPGGLAALVAGRLLGLPYVVTLHGSDVTLAHQRGLRWLARTVARRAAAVTAVSAALASEAAGVLGLAPERIAVIPMPVPPPVDADTPPPHLPPPPPLRVLAVGRLVVEKGFDVLVAAAVQLRAAGVDVDVEIVGAGPEEANLRRLGTDLGPHLVLPGALARKELHQRMRAVHVVAIPSRREGLGLAAVEALALGRPVVASRVGGLIETVADPLDGVLVEPDDPVALATALRRCALQAPTGRSVARHRPATVASAFADLYAEVLRTGGGRL
jgi:glycosyltransferase involved in cell wall biosynthesis